ncbi:hypothetical protein [Dyella sp. Tek66A03]|uniref:hypothetical protein n=1 Tax=Dyella sp. Tek66A03 TaxID=3458298 RepID=UPI00403E371C
MAATNGYVYVNFPKGTGGGALKVQAVNGGSKQMLLPRSDADQKAYGLWLPPGDYRIAQWDSYGWGDYPTFKVEAGRVTDLGSLAPINIGGYQLVILPVRAAENAHDIDGVLREYASLLKSQDPIVWQPSVPPTPIQMTQGFSGLGIIADLLTTYDRKVNKTSVIAQLKAAKTNEEFLRLARGVTPPITDRGVTDAAGNLYFGADFGQVRIRHPDGSWDGVGIDTLHGITAVAYVDQTLVAGSDNGVLRESTDGGHSWRDIRSFGADEAIVDIEQEGKKWVVTTAHQVPLPLSRKGTDRLSVYVAQQGGLEALNKAREFPLDAKNMLGWMGADGQLVQGAYYVNTFNELYRLNLDSLQWKAITPPTTISSHHVDPASGVISVLWSKGIFSKVFVSVDHGDTWKRVKRPPYAIFDVQFDDTKNAYALRMAAGAFKGTWEIYTYNAQIDDWTQVSDAPFQCKPMRVSQSVPVFCISSDGSILSQREKDWNVEFSAQ